MARSTTPTQTKTMSAYKNCSAVVATAFALILSSASVNRAAIPVGEQERSPAALQARLDEAESSFRNGKLRESIDQASSLLNLTDSSFFQSESIAQEAKADLAVFQLKAGNPDQTAKLMRELFLSLQLELQADPKFPIEPAQVLAGAPAVLKEHFSKVINRLHESPDTKLIVESIIDNTYPKNYASQLKTFCTRLKATLDQLEPLRSVAETEELRYGDPLTPLADETADDDSDPRLSAANLEKIGRNLDTLATQAQQLPAGDLRAAHGLYTLALLANSAKRYQQAEMFAQQGVRHVEAIADNLPLVEQLQIVLAYSLLRQGKTEAFNSLKDDLLKRTGDQEPLLVTLARLTQFSGDNSGAASIFKRSLDNRTKRGSTSPPEWIDNYNQLLKELGSGAMH